MTKITDYDVVSANDLDKMINMVNIQIKESGWQPYGSFQVSVPVIDEGPAPLYSQAMVRYENA